MTPIGPPTGRRLATISSNQLNTPHRYSCCDCPKSTATDSAATKTNATELLLTPAKAPPRMSTDEDDQGGHFITPPEVTNTGPSFNRGSEGGARGCGFEERVGAHARTGGIQFPMASLCVTQFV